MPDPVNLSKVNVTIQQFDDIARGKYNAGEVRLSGEESLAKMNNHVTFTSKNNVSISHAEVIAIKEAFIKALSDNGVSKQAIAGVRRELGLAAEGGVVDRDLRSRNIKPLTRQQIRSIIDQNAAAINSRSEGTVGTSETIYADVAEHKMLSRAAERDQVNASVDSSRHIEENASFAMFESVVGGDASFSGSRDRAALLDMANDIRARIMRATSGKPSADAVAVLRHSFENGQTMTFDTGLSESDFVKRLDDVIARLRFGAAGESVTSDKAHNKAIAEALGYKGANAVKLPYEFKDVANEVISALRKSFGKGLVKGNACLGNLLTVRDVDALVDVSGDNPIRATPESLRSGLLARAKSNVLMNLLDRRLDSMMSAGGLDVATHGFRNNLKGSLPEMFEQLEACANKKDAEAVVDRFADQIKGKIHQRAVAERCRADVQRMCLDMFASATGIPRESLERGDLNTEHLVKRAKDLSYDVSTGAKVFGSDAEIESAFKELVHGFVSDRAAVLAKADSLELSEQSRIALKRTLLAVGRTDDMDLESLVSMASDAPVSALRSALAPGMAKEDVFRAIDSFYANVDRSLVFAYPKEGRERGIEELSTAMAIFYDVAVIGDDELASALTAFFSRDDIEGEDLTGGRTSFQSAVLSHNVRTNGMVAASIGKPEMDPFEAQVLAKVCDELGMADMTPAEMKGVLSSNEVRVSLAKSIREYDGKVTLEVLHELATTHLRGLAIQHALGKFIATLAEDNGVRLTADDVSAAISVVLGRDKGLVARAIENMEGGGLQESARAQFNAQKKSIAMLVCAFGDIRAVAEGALDRAIEAIAKETGMSGDLLRRKLDIGALGIDTGGSLRVMRKVLADEFVKADCDVSKFDRKTVMVKAQEKLQKFIASKVGQIEILETLDLPKAVKESLKLSVINTRDWKKPGIVSVTARAFASPEGKAALNSFLGKVTPESVDKMSDEQVFNALVDVVREIFEKAHAYDAELGDKGSLRDNDDFGMMSALINKLVIGAGGKKLEDAFARLCTAGRLDSLLKSGEELRADANAVYMDALYEVTTRVEEQAKESKVQEDPKVIANRIEKDPQVITASKPLQHIEKAERLYGDLVQALRERWLSPEDAEAIRTSSATLEQKANGNLVFHAIAKGYALGEVETLKTVAGLYRKATGCTFEEAEAAALDPSSVARRLYSYGGRFIASPENFGKGLSLIQSFGTWFEELVGSHGDGLSITAINSSDSFVVLENKPGFERFLFDEIAVNEDIDLNVDDPDSVFCMENNPAMRFVGLGYANGCANTVLNVPPQRREVVYEVFDVIAPLSDVRGGKGPYGKVGFQVLLLSRLFLHFDEVVALKDRGEFTRENLVRLLYADHNVQPTATNEEIEQWLQDALWGSVSDNPNLAPVVLQAVLNTGLPLNEVADAVKAGRTLPDAPYVASYMVELKNLTGDIEDAREQAVLDFSRPAGPVGLPEANNRFIVDINGSAFVSAEADDPTHDAINGKIIDKVAEFCGAVHPLQAKAVLYCISQSGSGPVKGLDLGGGILATEHLPLTYTLTKDADTGTVIIRYSEPEGLAKKFHWEVSVDVNGIATSTPLVDD